MAYMAREVTINFTVAIEGMERFRRSITRLLWTMRFWNYAMHGKYRPDGRPRRTGHRHQVTVGWTNRYRTKA